LPQLEAPPPPVTSREVPRPAPPPPAPKAPPPQQPAQRPPPQPAPRPPQQGLQSSPLSHLPPPRTPAEQQAARQAPTFTNPADMLGQKRAEEQYLWYVAQKISQHQQFVRNVTTETGTVVVRLTIARDGRLVDVSLVRSSGLPSLDTASINVIRSAGPYPLLPEDIAGPQHTFVLPLTYRRSE
jgi:protein TonB